MKLKQTAKTKNRKLVTLFAGSYAGFALVMLLFVVLIYWASYNYSSRVLSSPDLDTVTKNADMLNGDYEKVDARHYFGNDGGFAVYDADGSLCYMDEENFSYILNAQEVFCVQDYDEYSFVAGYTTEVPKEGVRYLAVKTIYSADSDDAQNLVMVLDKNFKVVSGAFEKGKNQYTEREYRILTGEFPENRELLRSTLPDGRILVAATKDWDINDYTTVERKTMLMYWSLLPICLLLIAFFIFWLNRKVKNPLMQLSAAISRVESSGLESARVGSLKGPYEIQTIARNFDHMADKLAESEAQRRKSDADRQKLLADISHDLKTPITVICGYTNAIADGKISPDKLGAYLHLINDKAEEVNELLNSFYEYNKVNHPQFHVEPVVTDICEFMREYLARRYDEIELAGFTLRIDIPDHMILCAVDAPMLTRALNNIIYNAMKYNALGTVMGVKIAKETERHKPNAVAIRLADNGVGIEPERRSRIFEPFVTGADSRNTEGSGLGLAITKKIVEAHGGTVKLLDKASPGFSTEFEIILPAVM